MTTKTLYPRIYELTLQNVDTIEKIKIIKNSLKEGLCIKVARDTELHDFFVESGIELLDCGEFLAYELHYYDVDIMRAFELENKEYLQWDLKAISIKEIICDTKF